MKIIFLLLPVLLCLGCNEKPAADDAPTDNGQTITTVNPDTLELEFPYTLSKADTTFILPDKLKELSGMEYISNSMVACIQDENGIVFMFDVSQGRLVKEIHWGEDGDYEGVAGTDAVLYILESGGGLYKLTNFNTDEKPQVQSLESSLDDCDAEGLALLPDMSGLLIACKQGSYGVRNIWSFNLNTQALAAEPYLQIHQKALEDKLTDSGLDKISLGVRKLLDAQGESGILAPSGIAVHPDTRDLYILSSASKLMAVIGSNGVVKHIQELPVSLFLQPESITFLPNGDMLIGNEGQGGDPTIMLFKYDNKIR
ncbi:hypothetical protein [Cesiribacter sp. SM1]|uniref:hypothetical protein n=1 Tax=Cesiribacter sp. SM1 TaxID=2861196 RepID=UPI001CD44D90|nr:hypothetical protein [Cesiribacter sp. SM1]